MNGTDPSGLEREALFAGIVPDERTGVIVGGHFKWVNNVIAKLVKAHENYMKEFRKKAKDNCYRDLFEVGPQSCYDAVSNAFVPEKYRVPNLPVQLPGLTYEDAAKNLPKAVQALYESMKAHNTPLGSYPPYDPIKIYVIAQPEYAVAINKSGDGDFPPFGKIGDIFKGDDPQIPDRKSSEKLFWYIKKYELPGR